MPSHSTPPGRDPASQNEGHHTFSFTYDDTGSTGTVDAPNGWIMQRVIDQGYTALGQGVKPDDRVEFGGLLMTPELRALKVKDFVADHPTGKFHVVSKPGGAHRRGDLSPVTGV